MGLAPRGLAPPALWDAAGRLDPGQLERELNRELENAGRPVIARVAQRGTPPCAGGGRSPDFHRCGLPRHGFWLHGMAAIGWGGWR